MSDKHATRLAEMERWTSVVPEIVMNGSRAQAVNVLTDAISDIQLLRSRLAAATLMCNQREREAMDASVLEYRNMVAWREITKGAAAFVEFVQRHTWPERHERHGAETVYSLIAHHPFAKDHGAKVPQSNGPTDALRDGEPPNG